MTSPPPSSPLGTDQPPGLSVATTPEAGPTPIGTLLFRTLVASVLGVGLLRAVSGAAPFWLFAGIYFPNWFAAGIVGVPLARVTVVALRAHPFTRPAGASVLFFSLTIVYAFLAWHFLFFI